MSFVMRFLWRSLATALILKAVVAQNGSVALNVDAIEDEPHIFSYDVELHDCPSTCVDYSNPHSWIPYLNANRLRRCQEPLLLQLSVKQPLADPESNVLIRTCSLSSGLSVATAGEAEIPGVENPKKAENIFQSSLEVTKACQSTGTNKKVDINVFTNSGTGADSDKSLTLLDGMRTYFAAEDNCDESTIFAYQNGTTVGIYIGEDLGKSTANTVLRALSERLANHGLAGNRTIAQLCGEGRASGTTFGVAIDTTDNLAAVQESVLNWSKGVCSNEFTLQLIAPLSNIDIMQLASSNSTNTTLSGNATTANNATTLRRHTSLNLPVSLHKRAACRYVEVISGDGCSILASRCGISGADFTKYNPASTFCSSLKVGDYACCSAGDRYTKPKPVAPSPNADGTCATHLIVDKDTCAALATKYGITVDNIEKWNKGKTWAWTACKDMLLGYNLCISDGTAALPPPQAGTACGPLVPGTKPPAAGQSLADLNPCPLNACCSNWGFCGVFPAHCGIHKPENGGPGTKLPGFQNTCVSNCGNEIKQNSGPPSKYSRVGYYESYNFNRDCLYMKSENANTDGSYTHMHWGFAE
jgi:hypothetical protein